MKQKIVNIYLEQSDRPITNYCCLVIETKSGECFKIEGVYKASQEVTDSINFCFPKHNDHTHYSKLGVHKTNEDDSKQKPNKKKIKASSLFT